VSSLHCRAPRRNALKRGYHLPARSSGCSPASRRPSLISGILIRGLVDSRFTRVQLSQQAEVAELESATQIDIAQPQERRQADQLKLQWQLFNAQKFEERVARLADQKRSLYGQFLLTMRC
jgi:hypothetical protein